jgi:hypothetical protein
MTDRNAKRIEEAKRRIEATKDDPLRRADYLEACRELEDARNGRN